MRQIYYGAIKAVDKKAARAGESQCVPKKLRRLTEDHRCLAPSLPSVVEEHAGLFVLISHLAKNEINDSNDNKTLMERRMFCGPSVFLCVAI